MDHPGIGCVVGRTGGTGGRGRIPAAILIAAVLAATALVGCSAAGGSGSDSAAAPVAGGSD